MRNAGLPPITIVVATLFACALDPGPPPIRYLEVGLTAAGAAPCSQSLALECVLENTSSQPIEGFAARVYLYDAAGDDDAGGKPTVVEWHNSRPMPAGESTAFCVDLAPAFHVIPPQPPLIDMLHVHEVTFADGSVWRDPLAARVWRRPPEGGGSEDG